jgi:myo-inositol catabolism protein IolC
LTLLLLAFDHRDRFRELAAGRDDAGTAIRAAKQLVWEGFVEALGRRPVEGSGIIVDEECGAAIARAARDRGVTLAMPVERGGVSELELEHGAESAAHLAAFDVDYAKVLLRYNVEGDAERNGRQRDVMLELMRQLAGTKVRLMLELVVPALPEQLAAARGDVHRFDIEIRPGLVRQGIVELHDAGIEPDLWKVEGVEHGDRSRDITRTVQRGGRTAARSIVLGRGGDDRMLDRWLRTAATDPGFIGFAIGRSIFDEAVTGFLDGTLPAAAASAQIADRYRRFVDVWLEARDRAQPGSDGSPPGR